MCDGRVVKAAKKMTEYFNLTYSQICVQREDGYFSDNDYYIKTSEYFEYFDNSTYSDIDYYTFEIFAHSDNEYRGWNKVPGFEDLSKEELENGTGKFTINSTYAQRIFHFFLENDHTIRRSGLKVDPEKERQFYGQTYEELLAGKTNTGKYSINDIINEVIHLSFKDYADKVDSKFFIPIIRPYISVSNDVQVNSDKKIFGEESYDKFIGLFNEDSDCFKEYKAKMDNIVNLYNSIYDIIEKGIKEEVYKQLKQQIPNL